MAGRVFTKAASFQGITLLWVMPRTGATAGLASVSAEWRNAGVAKWMAGKRATPATREQFQGTSGFNGDENAMSLGGSATIGARIRDSREKRRSAAPQANRTGITPVDWYGGESVGRIQSACRFEKVALRCSPTCRTAR